MGFAALTGILVPLFLLPAVIWLWALWFHRRSPRKKKVFPLIAAVRTSPQVMFVLIGLTLTVFWFGLRGALPAEARSAFTVFPFVGVILFALGANYAKELPRGIAVLLQAFGTRLAITQSQVVLLLTSPLLAALATMASGDVELMRAPFVALVAWGLAIAAVLLGCWPQKSRPLTTSRKVLLWAGILFIAALLLRGLNANGIPNILTGDEASAGLFAVEYLKGRVDNVFGFGWYSFPALYFYFQALSISIFGQTTLALRITSALAGALTVGAVYLVGRALYNHRAGLYAAIFLAGLHLHLHFSRIGLNNIWDGFWFTVVIGLLWWGWNEQRRDAFLLAGFSLGISQYFYISARMLFVLVPIWLLLAALRDRARFKRVRASMLLMFAVALVVFLPLATNFAQNVDRFMEPLERVSLLGPWLDNQKVLTGLPASRILASEMWLSIQAYTNANLRHWYTPEVPILRSYAAGFFLLGVVLMLLDWRKPQHWLIALWLGAFTVSGGLSESTPAAQRYIGVAPACALVLGFALHEISERVSPLWRTSKRVVPAIALIIVVLLSISDINFYFRQFTPRGEYTGPNGAVAQHLADYLNARPEIEQVAFFGTPRMGYYSIPSTAFLAPKVVGLDMHAPWGSSENPPITSDQVVFVFLPEHFADLEALLASFPHSLVLTESDMLGSVLFWLVEIRL